MNRFLCRLMFLLLVSLAVQALLPVVATPTATAQKSQPISVEISRQLAQLENRFFFHRYERDTLEKRLQRLELLVFGATQEGSNGERLTRLRNKFFSQNNTRKNSLKPHNISPNHSSGSIPKILDTLEIKILKRAHTGEPAHERLAKLEEKLFGQASPMMSSADRIERLKKAAGFEAPAVSTLPFRTMPGQKGRRGEMPFISPFEHLNPYQQSPFSELMPNMEPYFATPQRELDPRLMRMFQQLSKRLRELRQLPPGSNPTDPGYSLKPETFPYSPFPKPNLPEATPLPPALPPYYDPNSI